MAETTFTSGEHSSGGRAYFGEAAGAYAAGLADGAAAERERWIRIEPDPAQPGHNRGVFEVGALVAEVYADQIAEAAAAERARIRRLAAEHEAQYLIDRGTHADFAAFADLLREGGAEPGPQAAECICVRFRDTGGFRIADLACPVHGVNGTEPGDGYWEADNA
jgi:hypothetical protein